MIDATTIREQVSIEDAFELLDLEMGSDRHHVQCPLPTHEDRHGSCSVSDSLWFCHSCGQGGDVIDLVMRCTGAHFGQALQFLAGMVDEMAVEPKIKQPPKEKEVTDLTEFCKEAKWCFTPEHDEFVKKRWPYLDHDDVAKYAIPVPDAWWVPHRHEGKVVGIKIRKLDGTKTSFPGSVFTKQLYVVSRPWFSDSAVICEGESDAWCMSKYLERNGKLISVFALPSGAQTWRHDWMGQLQDYLRVYICTDNDEAGIDARMKIEQSLSKGGPPTQQLMVPFGWNDVSEALANGWQPFTG